MESTGAQEASLFKAKTFEDNNTLLELKEPKQTVQDEIEKIQK